MSLIVKVNLRKKNKLYIDDGVHGYLHNAGAPGFSYPVKILENRISQSLSLSVFTDQPVTLTII